MQKPDQFSLMYIKLLPLASRLRQRFKMSSSVPVTTVLAAGQTHMEWLYSTLFLGRLFKFKKEVSI